MSRHTLTVDERRRGGEASGEARRKRKLRSWQDEFLEAVEADPRAFVAGLLSSSNECGEGAGARAGDSLEARRPS